MRFRKKLIAIVMALVTAISSLALCFNAFAITYRDMALDVIYMSSINGVGDVTWYSYTPELSGTYTFLAYCTGKTEAYLYTMSVNENGSKNYNGLAYAGPSDPNSNDDYHTFEYNGTTYTHTSTSFRLTYHLEAGTTYYYTAGWANNQANGTVRVRLTNESYDYQVLDSVSAESTAYLTWYTDGEWRRDKNNNSYYYYNFSKILQNMVVTITYKDGSTVSSDMGANTVDGYQITYSQNQDLNHWYISTAEEYTSNTITVTVMGISFDYEVEIKSGEMFMVKGSVSDMTNDEPLANAELQIRNQTIAKTDKNGEFSFGYAPGKYVVVVKAPNAISRTITIKVDAQNTANNDHRATPIPVLVADYVQDGYVNGKDFAYMVKNKLTEKQKAFSKYADFDTNSYSQFDL